MACELASSARIFQRYAVERRFTTPSPRGRVGSFSRLAEMNRGGGPLPEHPSPKSSFRYAREDFFPSRKGRGEFSPDDELVMLALAFRQASFLHPIISPAE